MDKLVNLESPSSSGDYSISVAVNAVTGIADADECHNIFYGPKYNNKSFVNTILSIDYNVPQGRSTARGISTLNLTTLDSMFSQRKKYQASSSNCKFSRRNTTTGILIPSWKQKNPFRHIQGQSSFYLTASTSI